MVSQFQAHNEQITCFSLLEMDKSYLLTGGYDYLVKIWDKSNQCNIHLVCLLNLNHPLPTKWALKDNQISKKKRKILFAIKVIDVIFKRYRKQILPSEEKLISLKPLFNQFNAFSEEGSGKKDEKEEVVLMRDEYSPRDLDYEKAKEMYRFEVQGYSVKQLEKQKEIRAIQEEQREERKTEVQVQLDEIAEWRKKREQQLQKEDEKSKLAEFLDPVLHQRAFQEEEEPQKKSRYIRQLENKLNDAVREH